MTRIDIPNEGSLPDAARIFASNISVERPLYAFYGEMGAGKTTFIRTLVRELGVDGSQAANSPSFSIVNEYDSPSGPIYHFDFYRLDSPAEALDFGVEEYFDSGALCLMEWPERIGSVLPEDAIAVRIEVNPDDSRTLYIDN